MKVIIVDERKGNVLTDEIKAAMKDAKTVFRIKADDTVVAEKGGAATGKTVTAHATFFEAPHEDKISAEKSRIAWEKQVQEKIAREGSKGGYSEEAMERAHRALGATP